MDQGPAFGVPRAGAVLAADRARFDVEGHEVDAWPVCLDTQDTEEIIRIVKAIAPVYGGVNLEDIGMLTSP